MTRKESKARINFGRAVTSFPEIGAIYCALTYPVKDSSVKGDSAEYKKSRMAFDSLYNSAKEDSVIYQQEIDRLVGEVNRVRSTMADSQNCDSLSEAIYRIAAAEKMKSNKLQEVNRRLLLAVENIKPIHDTLFKESSSRLKACELEREAVLGMVADREKKLDAKTAEAAKWRKTAKNRFWTIAAMSTAMLLGLFVAVRKKIVKMV